MLHSYGDGWAYSCQFVLLERGGERWFDSYSFSYPGGVFHNAFIKKWGELVKFLDQGSPAAPVDEDSDRSMLRAAFNEHKGNSDVYETFKRLPYRNSWDQETNSAFHLACSPTSYISEIENSGVAIYHLAGWYDGWPRDQLLWFNNLKNPQKIIIGPWHHGDRGAIDWTAEHLRWFDYWLKGIDNGIIDEPPIYYYTMGAIKGKEWRFARQWPLANEKPTLYYLRSGPSGSVNSINDGFLSRRPPTSTTGKDEYTVDYTTTTGITNRWTAMYGAKFDYPDMTENDKKGLTYTTPPLASDVEVTGHPMVHLWISSTATDGDFFAYLEEVDAEGLSHYITEGTLRASHRSLSTPPFEYIGLPWHRSFKEDCDDLPKDKPVELVFDLHPTSNIFDAGHRIRVTITCADKDNNLTPELSPAPRVSVYRNTNYASYIKLPVIPVAIK